MKYLSMLAGVILSLVGAVAFAQTTTPAQPSNVYAAGASYSVGGSPAVAGTALYAHSMNSVGTYAFTVADFVPNTVKPLTVSTNLGVGVSQQLVSVGRVAVFIPTAAGISFTGTNTGWQWTSGALASIHLKGNYYLMPNVRFLKSSVTNGTGYQPVIGVLFGWGS